MAHYAKAKNLLLAVIASMALVLFSSALIYAYMSQKRSLQEGNDRQLITAAQGIKKFFSDSYINRIFVTPPTQEEYKNIVHTLSRFSWDGGLEYAYILRENQGKIVFLADSASPQEFIANDYTSFGGEYTDASDGLKQAFLERKPIFDEYTDKWGTHRSLFLPVQHSQGTYVIGIDISLQSIYEQLDALIMKLIFFAVVVLIIAALGLYFLNRKADKWLELSEKMYESLEEVINLVPTPLFVKNEKGHYIVANKATNDFFGCNAMGLTDEDLFSVEEREELLNEDRRVLEDNHRLILSQRVLTSPQGSKHTFQGTKIPIIWPLDNSKAILGIMTDITNNVAITEELIALNTNLNKKVEEGIMQLRERDALLLRQSRHIAAGELISAIAHHWRQPLNAVSIIAQDLVDAAEYQELTPSYLNDNVDKIVDITQKLSQTIESFRAFYSDNSPEELFSVREEIEKILFFFQPLLEQLNIIITARILTESSLKGDSSDFRQMLIAIIKNAQDVLAKSDNHEKYLTLTAKEEEGCVIITIADNGGGIPSTIIERVFDPYFTTKQVGEGTGTGLYLTKIIVEKMNGTITTYNNTDGAVFKIVLPLNEVFYAPF